MKSTTHTRKPSLQILALDRRDLPSGVTLNSLGTLDIDCGNLNDAVTVSNVGTSVKARVITTAGAGGLGTVFEKSFPAASVQRIWFHGRLGNDKFTNLTNLAARVIRGYRALKWLETWLPPKGKALLPQAADQLIILYTVTWNQPEAMRWRAERADYPPEE